MAWSELEFSKSQVQKAGRTLRKGPGDPWNAYSAVRVLQNFRESHQFPMNTKQTTLRRRAREIDKNVTVVQRLKRFPSIVQKLRREPSMRLINMQDIGGCRAILPNKLHAYKLLNKCEKSNDQSEIVKVNDYIKAPSRSGYRGIHIIYQFKSKQQPKYNDRFIEVQIRSEIEHVWATAVEVAGTLTLSDLKSGFGSK